MSDSGNDDHYPGISRAERRAIELHKYYLSKSRGYDVGERYAVEDWLTHHSPKWRQERLKRDLAEQAREILKHKWIESEKAGRDLGHEAVIDWIRRFAADWRKTHEDVED
jgi:hypothetical protein